MCWVVAIAAKKKQENGSFVLCKDDFVSGAPDGSDIFERNVFYTLGAGTLCESEELTYSWSYTTSAFEYEYNCPDGTSASSRRMLQVCLVDATVVYLYL